MSFVVDSCCDCNLAPGMYGLNAQAEWEGMAPTTDLSVPNVPFYLAAEFKADATGSGGGTAIYDVTFDSRNSTLTSGDITGAAASAADIPVAVAFANLLTSGVWTSPTVLSYDDGAGTTASLTLKPPTFTLANVYANVHELLGAVPYSAVVTDDIAIVEYTPGQTIFSPSLLVPTVFDNAGVYKWGWGSGGLVNPGTPPSGYGHTAPLPPRVTDSGIAVLQAFSGYTQYGNWGMIKTLYVNPTSCPIYMRDDFTATPGPPTQTTPQFPTISCTTPGILDLTPIGTIIDIAAATSQMDYTATRSFLHF